MLINTVILFLRDALPMFVVLTILLSLLNQQGIKHTWCYFAGAIGLLSSVTLLATIDAISNTFDGAGRELLYGLLYFFCYLVTLFLLAQSSCTSRITFEHSSDKNNGINASLNNTRMAKIRYCASAIVAVVITLKSTHFLIYITGFWSQNDAFNVLLTGMILGAGICTSIAILLYFFMDFLVAYYRLIRETLLVLFSAGLLMQATNLLLQIDALPSGTLLWDSNDIVLENSEIGQLLNVFFGYDATPTLLQLSLYILALVIAFALIFSRMRFIKKKQQTPIPSIKNNNIKEVM